MYTRTHTQVRDKKTCAINSLKRFE